MPADAPGSSPEISPEISYVITQHNKAAFLPLLVEAFAREGGDFTREYVFVDDGSSDDSVTVLKGLAGRLPGPLRLIEQENGGASAATNTGVLAARARLVRLVDGDDLVTPGSTAQLREAMRTAGVEFAYGDLGEYAFDQPFTEPAPDFPAPVPLRDGAGLARFIRNCPVNSSAILMTADLYRRCGGCNETLVSPDYLLFLRAFAEGDGVHLPAPVARIPTEAPGRLSGQQRRSRYESVLALIILLEEQPALPRSLAVQAYRRALSRSYNYARLFGAKGLKNPMLWPYAFSKLSAPAQPLPAMRRALAAYTEDGRIERPTAWLPGAARRGVARTRIG